MTASAVAASEDTEAQARTERSLFMPSSIVSNLELSRNPLMGLQGAFRILCIRILNAGFSASFHALWLLQLALFWCYPISSERLSPLRFQAFRQALHSGCIPRMHPDLIRSTNENWHINR